MSSTPWPFRSMRGTASVGHAPTAAAYAAGSSHAVNGNGSGSSSSRGRSASSATSDAAPPQVTFLPHNHSANSSHAAGRAQAQASDPFGLAQRSRTLSQHPPDSGGSSSGSHLRMRSPSHIAVPVRPPSLTELRRQFASLAAMTPELVADWLNRQLRPALLQRLPPGAADLPLRRASTLAELEADGDFQHLLQLYVAHAQRATPLLGELLQQPQQTAMMPSTAEVRTAAASNAAPVQFSAAGCSAGDGGKASVRALLKSHLAVLTALVGSDGVVRMLLSDGQSSSGQVSSTLLSSLMAATWSGPGSTNGSVFSLLAMMVEQMRALGPHTSAFQLKATFTPLHDLQIPALCTRAMQLLCQLLPLHQGLQSRSSEAAKDRQVVGQRLLHALQLLNSISAARQDSTRSAEWQEQLRRITPSTADHSHLAFCIASTIHSLTGAKRSVGGLHSAADAIASESSSSGSASASQHVSQDNDSQTAENEGSQSVGGAAAATGAASSNITGQNSEAAKAMWTLMLQLLKELYIACANPDDANTGHASTRNKLQLCVFEIALHTLQQQRSHDRLLELLLLNEERLLPLLSAVLIDPASHLQLLCAALRVLLATFTPLPPPNAESFAGNLKDSGVVHLVMLQCARLADPALEAEHMHRDGIAPRTVIPVAVQLLAAILARCAKQRQWEPDQQQEWQAAIQRLQHYEWSSVCKEAAAALASGPMDAVDLLLSLLAHWHESYRSSSSFRVYPSVLDSSCVTSMLDRMLANVDPRLAKPQLLRICQLLMLCERDFGVTIAQKSQRVLFESCIRHQLRIEDLNETLWTWLWHTELTTTELRRLQQDMLCKLLLEVPDGADTLSRLRDSTRCLAVAGANGLRPLLRILQELINALAKGVAQPMYDQSIAQLGNRTMTLLHLIVEQDAFGLEEPGSSMQLLLQLGFHATLNGLLLRKWHRVGLFESSGLLALPSSMPLHEADEVAERSALQTHEHVIALCAAIGKQHKRPSQGGAAGEDAQLATIIDAVLDMFHGHLSSILADLRLHVSILELLRLLLECDERTTVQRLSDARSLAILQWITSHLPASNSLPTVHDLSHVFKPLPGVCGLNNEETIQYQSLQMQMQLQLLRLLERLLPAARRFNSLDDPNGSRAPADLRITVDASCFARFISVKQLCFLAAQPLIDLKEAVYSYLRSCFKEKMIEFGEEHASDASNGGPHPDAPSKQLRLAWNDARRLTLGAQSTLQIAMAQGPEACDPNKIRAAAEAVHAWQLMLQQCPAKWRTKLTRLPWNTFLLRTHLSQLGESAGSSTPLPSPFVHFFASLCGWSDEVSVIGQEQGQTDPQLLEELQHIMNSDRTNTLLQAVERALTPPAKASPTTIQHVLQLLVTLHQASLLSDELAARCQQLLLLMGGAWQQFKPPEEPDMSSSAGADGRMSIDLFEFVGLRMELLHEALAPQAPAEQTEGEPNNPLSVAAAGPDELMGEAAAASALGTPQQSHLGMNGATRDALKANGPGSQLPAPLSQADDHEQPTAPIPSTTCKEPHASPTPMDTSHDER